MSADESESDGFAASLFIPNQEWGVGIEPVAGGDNFFTEPCPVSQDVVMWYLALPEEFNDLSSIGSIDSGKTAGGRGKTKWQLRPTSAIYNRFLKNEDQLSEDHDVIHGYLLGLHECIFDLTFETEGDRGQTVEEDGIAVLDPAGDWEQEFGDSRYFRSGGISQDEVIAYRVERLDGLPNEYPEIYDVLKPLEEFGVERLEDSPTDVEITDEDERERIRELLESGEDPRSDNVDPGKEFEMDSGGASISDAGGFDSAPSDTGSSGSSSQSESGSGGSSGGGGSGGSSDSSGGSDAGDTDPIPSSESELAEMGRNELSNAASALGLPGDVFIGTTNDELRDAVREAVSFGGGSSRSAGESGGGGTSGGGSSDESTVVESTFGSGSSAPDEDFSSVDTSAAVDGDTILIRHEITGDGVSEVSSNPDFDPDSIKQDVERKVMENVERQVGKMVEGSGGGAESGDDGDDDDAGGDVTPESASDLLDMTYNELQQMGSSLGLGGAMSGADTAELRELIADSAPGIDAGDLPDDDAASTEADQSGGDGGSSDGDSGSNPQPSAGDVPFDAPQQILLTTTGCVNCKQVKDDMRDLIDSGQVVEVNETKDVFFDIVDSIDESTAPVLVLWDGEQFTVQEGF